LAECGIYTNFNTIPFDPNPPMDPSGIRLGTPALTTRGMKEEEMKIVGQAIAQLLKNIRSEEIKKEAKETVQELTKKFPIYKNFSV
jgi:glycine hydroxymethyltransferase